MKRVLFVMMSFHSGGAERSLVNLLHQLPKEKYAVDLMLFKKEGVFLSQLPEYVRVLDTPKDLAALYSEKKTPIRLIGTAAGRLMEGKNFSGRLYRWKHFYSRMLTPMQGHYDVAVAYLQGEPAYYVADFVNADRKLIWVHTDYSNAGMKREYDLPAFRKADALVTISPKCLDALRAAFPEFADKSFCVENITSASQIRKMSEGETPAEFAPDAFNILSIGRLAEPKGFDLAADAAAILKAKGLRFRWLVMGDGDLRQPLTEQIQRLGIGDCFRLIGIRPNPYPYIRCADLLAQTSRWEGKSVVLDEAKMIGTPVLATRYPTAGDQIIDGKDGILCGMTPEDIAAALERLAADEALRRKISAYQLAHDYDNVSEVRKYEALLDGE